MARAGFWCPRETRYPGPSVTDPADGRARLRLRLAEGARRRAELFSLDRRSQTLLALLAERAEMRESHVGRPKPQLAFTNRM